MPADENAAALPLSGRAAYRLLFALLKFGQTTRDYIRVVGWVLSAMGVLYVADLVGTAAALPFSFAHHQPAWVSLLLSVNVYNLSYLSNHILWEVFFSLAMVRMMISDPLHYWFGARTGSFIAELKRHPKTGDQQARTSPKPRRPISRMTRFVMEVPFVWAEATWLKRRKVMLTKRLARAINRMPKQLVILVAVFIVTVIQIPRPFSYILAPANPFVWAGATGVRLWKVMLVDFVASLTFLIIFYFYGESFVALFKQFALAGWRFF